MFKTIIYVAVLAIGPSTVGLASEPDRPNSIDTVLVMIQDEQTDRNKLLAAQYLWWLRSGEQSSPFDYPLLTIHMKWGNLTPEDIGTTEDELTKFKPKDTTPPF